MICYFDTSALVKRYFSEEGTETVLKLFEQADLLLVTSSITLVEGYHGICRKCVEDKLSTRIRNRIINQFKKDLTDFKIVDFLPVIVQRAQKIIGSYTLKTLDAIHLASALAIKHNPKVKIHFVSSDGKQGAVAQKYGLILLHPQ